MNPFNVQYPFAVHTQQLAADMRMAFVDEGQGTPVVFIHGLASYLGVWRHNIPELSKQFRCLAIDLPGNGLSTRGDYPFTLFFYAESVAAFLRQQQLDKVTLVGHSMGGQIALVLALRYPQLVHKLVLSAPAGFEPYAPQDKLVLQQLMLLGNYVYADRLHLLAGLRDGFYQVPPDADTMAADLDTLFFTGQVPQYRQMVQASMNGMLNEQVFDFLPEIKCPTLVVFGLNDKLIPNRFIHPSLTTRQVAEQAVARMPQATLVLLDRCGHFVHYEQWRSFNKHVLQFLA